MTIFHQSFENLDSNFIGKPSIITKHSINFSTTPCLKGKRKKKSSDFNEENINKKLKSDFENDISETNSDNENSLDSSKRLDKGKGKEVESESSSTNSDNNTDMPLYKGKGIDLGNQEPNQDNTNVDESPWNTYRNADESDSTNEQSSKEENIDNLRKITELTARNVGERLDRNEPISEEEETILESIQEEYSSFYKERKSNKEFLYEIKELQANSIQDELTPQ